MIDSLGLEQDLHDVIIAKYKQGHHTDAIKDAFLHMTEYLRKESGYGTDGTDLVGKALGGETPPIILNERSNETEKGFQDGVQAILRGMYQALRNPRNHGKHNDTESEAIRIILLIDYMLKTIRTNKINFNVEKFVTERVMDKHFVENVDYARMVVEEIPPKFQLRVFYEVFNRRNERDLATVRLFFRSLYSVFEEPELKEIMNLFGEKLLTCEEKDVMNYIVCLRSDLWLKIPINSKTRIEQMLLASLSKGTTENNDGSLGTWSFIFGKYFDSKEKLFEIIMNRLFGTWYLQNYLAPYVAHITQIFESELHIKELSRGLIYAAMFSNAHALKNRLNEKIELFPDSWKESLREAIKDKMDNTNQAYAEELLEKLN